MFIFVSDAFKATCCSKYVDYVRGKPVRFNKDEADWLKDTQNITDLPLYGVDRKVYIIGSLRENIAPDLACFLRETMQCEVFDDWHSAGNEADDKWKSYEQYRGRDYVSALKGHAAQNVFNFDKKHIDESTDVILTLPSGKSGHLELGYCVGKGKRTYILLQEGEDPRWDVMYNFADHVVETREELLEKLNA